MKVKFSFLIACGLMYSLTSLAQHQMWVKVVDKQGNVLPGAKIALKQEENSFYSQTDIEGIAGLSITEFPIELEMGYMGMESRKVQLTSVPTSDTLVYELNKNNHLLNEVVVTGVGKPTRVEDAISIYKIIKAEDIAAMGAVTLNDALRNQLGLNIGNDQALGSTISMRGFSGNNVKVLIDGLPINGRENGNIDLSQVNMMQVEKIEMVQGPMSVMYGSDALGGVINIITKNVSKVNTAEGQFFYESIGKYNVNASTDVSHKKSKVSLGLGRNYFQGWDPENSEVRNPLWRPKEQYLANLKFTYDFNKDASITFATNYVNDKLSLKGDTAGYSFYNRETKDQYYYTNRWMNRLVAKWKTGKSGYWQSNNGLAIYRRTRETYWTDLSTMDRYLSPVTSDQTVTSFTDFTSRTTYANQVGKLQYTTGYDVNLEFANSTDKIKDGDKFIGDFALFLQAEYAIFPTLSIQPALRATYNSAYNAPLVPSFALLYKPNEKWNVRANYARGFRAPALKEMYLDFVDNNHDIVGNTNLKAEFGNHFQFSTGYKWAQKNNFNAITTLTAYYDDVHNQIALAIADTTGKGSNSLAPYTYTNIGRARFFTLQWINQVEYEGLTLQAGASYNRSISTESLNEKGDVVSKTPDFDFWEANVQGRYRVKAWKMGVGAYYKLTGSQPMLGSDITQGTVYGNKVQAFHNLDLSVDKSFFKNRIALIVGVRNVFDNVILNYTGSGGSTGGAHGSSNGSLTLTPGRSFFTTLRVSLNY